MERLVQMLDQVVLVHPIKVILAANKQLVLVVLAVVVLVEALTIKGVVAVVQVATETALIQKHLVVEVLVVY